MKSKLILFCFLIIIFTLNGCGLISIFEPQPYSSVFINLYNNTGNANCMADSTPVIFKVSNFTDKSQKEIITEIKPKSSRSVNLVIKKGDFLLVKVLNTRDSSLIVEKTIKSADSKYLGGDLVPRNIIFCKKEEFVIENF